MQPAVCVCVCEGFSMADLAAYPTTLPPPCPPTLCRPGLAAGLSLPLQAEWRYTGRGIPRATRESGLTTRV